MRLLRLLKKDITLAEAQLRMRELLGVEKADLSNVCVPPGQIPIRRVKPIPKPKNPNTRESILEQLLELSRRRAYLVQLRPTADKDEKDKNMKPTTTQTKIPGVGLPIPILPEGWRSNWCPQLKPDDNYTPPPEAVAAGWDWKKSCPLSGWRGWFAEHYPRTVAALRCGWEENRWGTKESHDGNFTILEFEYAEVFIDKNDPIFRSDCYLATDAGNLPIPVPGGGNTLPALGTSVEVLIDGTWIRDEVKTAAGGRTLVLKSGRRPGGRLLLLADEGRTWRRVQASPPPSPVPPLPPLSIPPAPPTPPEPQPQPTLPPLSPLDVRVKELRELLIAAGQIVAGDSLSSLIFRLAGAVANDPVIWFAVRPLATELLQAWRVIRKLSSRDPRALP